tara:strand:- start:2 stop:436 length:435 start_codon:yes stop_codon:yes gene_type:complete
MSKRKGTRNERELFHMFWDNDWVALRTAGSGSTPLPAPDLIVSGMNVITTPLPPEEKILAIECKAIKSNRKYFSQKEINELNEFSKKFGASPYIAIKFDRKEWRFVHTKDMGFAKTNHYISLDLAQKKGLKFEEIIGKYKQLKL